MKKLISQVPETSGNTYELWAELTDCYKPEGYKMLKFTSIWSGAKNPKLPYNKGEFFLSPEALSNLNDLLQEKK